MSSKIGQLYVPPLPESGEASEAHWNKRQEFIAWFAKNYGDPRCRRCGELWGGHVGIKCPSGISGSRTIILDIDTERGFRFQNWKTMGPNMSFKLRKAGKVKYGYK